MAISRVPETSDKSALVEAEVYRWYNLFFPWSRGVASQSEGAIKPLYDALASDFRVVLTDGQIMDRADYWERLWGLYGKRVGSPESHIINLSITPLPGDLFLTVFDLVKDGITKKKSIRRLCVWTPHRLRESRGFMFMKASMRVWLRSG